MVFLIFLSDTLLRAAFANESALLFPWIPIWIGIQQNITFSLFLIETSLSAKFIAQISAENMEGSFGRYLFKVFFWWTASHLVP